jgi:ATP-dependent helicase/nuclease subunit A
MSDFLADEQPIDEHEFKRRACDPRSSVVVEACAGSGKTWLLVGRIVRALLAGAAPGHILAITFTRRAAQEMRVRLMQDLEELALADDDGIAGWLQQRGMSAEEARGAVGVARGLYERVATARVPLAIDTFHGWFWQLVAGAPLGAGVPYAPVLLEAADRTRVDAWLHFTAQLVQERHAAQRRAWEWLLDEIGEDAAHKLLMQFLNRRAEWWCFAGDDEEAAVARSLAPLRASGDDDPRRRVRAPEFAAALHSLADLWQSIGAASKTAAQAAERARQWLATPSSDPAQDLSDACLVVLTKGEQTPIKALDPDRVAARFAGPAEALRYGHAHAAVVGHLQGLLAAHRTWRALKLNEAALACGRLLVAAYQRLKAQQQALDFTDLEWHAHRLLADADYATYMQVRLDARYRHILIDEFQDTNPLQWQVLQSWLAAYGEMEAGEAADRPSVFIVGDPKQSIYRFRRAEPRVFDAARDMLRRDFGATHLRTNVTRRNAGAVIDVLNRAMAGNRLYQAQRTLSEAKGAFVLLPLAAADGDQPSAAGSGLRDVLTQPRAERDSETRHREGCLIAREIVRWVASVRVREQGGERAARYSDVLLLVRRRTHLAEYERALRDAGVPFVSDRRGGLLATLEADDLTALLEFLTTPQADLRLAHALRSPVFSCTDDDLIRIAGTAGATWWQRLQAIETGVSAALDRARDLLSRWLQAARLLPVHDLLDRVYFEGDVRRRYAAAAPATLQAQVQANLDAFIELALAIDAGRYPSLPRFLDELTGLKRHAPEEAPDEGLAEVDNAVRVMTIHGAKGLEADIVVLADAHARPTPDAESVLVVWPPEAAAPEHVSLVARGEQARDVARAAWFADDDAQRAQEDWNLLYVAATRARQVLVVAGSAPAKGEPDDTWYTRLQAAQELSCEPAGEHGAAPIEARREVRDFRPAPRPTGSRRAAVPLSGAQRLGLAWHALLEQGRAADIGAIARTNELTPEQRAAVVDAAQRVRHRLPQFFSDTALAELDLVAADGELLRVDRLVELDDALWIVDFKWRVTDAERGPYEAQVRRYADVLRAIRRDKPVKLGLVTADGELVEVKG